jgi:hypothetical protein
VNLTHVRWFSTTRYVAKDELKNVGVHFRSGRDPE